MDVPPSPSPALARAEQARRDQGQGQGEGGGAGGGGGGGGEGEDDGLDGISAGAAERALIAAHFLRLAGSTSLGSICVGALGNAPAELCWLAMLRGRKAFGVCGSRQRREFHQSQHHMRPVSGGASSSAAASAASGGAGGGAGGGLLGGLRSGCGYAVAVAVDRAAALVQRFHRFAFCHVAGYSKSFGAAARESWQLLEQRGVEGLIEADICCRLLLLPADALAGLVGVVGGVMVQSASDDDTRTWFLMCAALVAMAYSTMALAMQVGGRAGARAGGCTGGGAGGRAGWRGGCWRRIRFASHAHAHNNARRSMWNAAAVDSG
jgi:hypothetical protein